MRARGVTALCVGMLALTGCSVAALFNPNVRTFTVPGSSMEPSIRAGQKIEARLVSNYTPHLGDVVIFRAPASWDQGDGKFIKRVLGTPGDHVSCDPKKDGGMVVINGRPLHEPYLPHKVVDRSLTAPLTAPYMPSTAPCQEAFSVTVPPGDIWLMGDNRGDSSDSRYHPDAPGGGAIPASNVVAIYKRG